MSSNEPDSIILRYLRKLDERTERIENNQKDLAADLRILKGHMAGFMQAETRQDGVMASMLERIERIEKRLDLSEV
jgi:uncharacterized protein (UPF0335 family)